MTLDELKVALVREFEGREKRKGFVSRLIQSVFAREEDGSVSVRHWSRSAVQDLQKYDFELREAAGRLGEKAPIAIKWDPRVGARLLREEDALAALEEVFREKDPALLDLLKGAKSETGNRWSDHSLTFYIENDEERERLLERMPAIRAALDEMKGEHIKVKVFALKKEEAFYAARERLRETSPELYSLLEDVVYAAECYPSGPLGIKPLFDETSDALLEHKEELEAAVREARKGEVKLRIEEAEWPDKRIRAAAKAKGKDKDWWGVRATVLSESQRARVDARIAEAREEMRPRIPADEKLRALADQLRLLADQIVEAGASVENLENVLLLKDAALQDAGDDGAGDKFGAQDCIHLHACRRLAKIARNEGFTFARGCNRRCGAYESEG